MVKWWVCVGRYAVGCVFVCVLSSGLLAWASCVCVSSNSSGTTASGHSGGD